ncbi:MAG: DsbA family oxidoreductase, partial [Notoacmeibacter sp.]
MQAKQETSKQISLDIYSDVVCPWCYIGLKRLEAAKALVPDDVSVDISWRSYQLDPTVPDGGYDYHAHMSAKFGGKNAVDAKFDQVRETGKSVGIQFNFLAIKVAPNTLKAHRLIRHVADDQKLQDAVVKRLFQAFFEEGQDIGDISVLGDLAAQCGLNAAEIELILESDDHREDVQAEISNAGRMGISGVPCFIFEQRY